MKFLHFKFQPIESTDRSTAENSYCGELEKDYEAGLWLFLRLLEKQIADRLNSVQFGFSDKMSIDPETMKIEESEQ